MCHSQKRFTKQEKREVVTLITVLFCTTFSTITVYCSLVLFNSALFIFKSMSLDSLFRDSLLHTGKDAFIFNEGVFAYRVVRLAR